MLIVKVLTVSEITPAADWWSYGAILLLLYTGKKDLKLSFISKPYLQCLGSGIKGQLLFLKP